MTLTNYIFTPHVSTPATVPHPWPLKKKTAKDSKDKNNSKSVRGKGLMEDEYFVLFYGSRYRALRLNIKKY